jgi:hypothetical protein
MERRFYWVGSPLLISANHIYAKTMMNQQKAGGREGIRTPDPLLAKQVLCQLSYTPTVG